MIRIAKFVKNWRVEMIWFAMIFLLGTIIPAKIGADGLCSPDAIFYYNDEDNACYEPVYDCWGCVIWPDKL